MTTGRKVLLTATMATVIGMVVITPIALHAATTGPCARHQLHVRSNGTQGAAGTIYGAWVFTNVSTDPCTMSGYPSLALYGKGGRPIPTTVKQDLQPGPTDVTLRSGGSATFHTTYNEVAEPRCPTSFVMQVAPAGSTKALFIPATLVPCRGIVHISAVQAGIHRA